jgi:hypothetical protein
MLGRLVGFGLKIDGLKIGCFIFQNVVAYGFLGFGRQKGLYHHFVPVPRTDLSTLRDPIFIYLETAGGNRAERTGQ